MQSHKKISNNYNTATTDKQNELFYRVNEKDEVLGSVTRRECHNETTKPWHRSTHVYLFNPKGEIYFSQRSLKKDTAAGQWTVSAGGHVKFGKTYEEIAETEVKEELGLKIHLEMIDKLVIDYGSEREIIGIFAGVTTKKPKLNKEEVEQIKLFNFDEIVKKFSHKEFDLSGGSRDTFKHVLKTGSLNSFKDNII